MSINWKDLLSRAAWTFIQVFIAAFLVAGEDIINYIVESVKEITDSDKNSESTDLNDKKSESTDSDKNSESDK